MTPPIQELIFLWPPPPPPFENRSKLQWLILVRIFNKFCMELLAEPLVHLKCFFFLCFVLFFVLKVPMDDINSAVHGLKSFAQDAAQAGRALAQGVPAPGWGGGSRGLASGEGCKGETPPYLRNFYMQFWGLKGALLPWLKKKKKSFWGAKNLRFPSLSLFFQTF